MTKCSFCGVDTSEVIENYKEGLALMEEHAQVLKRQRAELRQCVEVLNTLDREARRSNPMHCPFCYTLWCGGAKFTHEDRNAHHIDCKIGIALALPGVQEMLEKED